MQTKLTLTPIYDSRIVDDTQIVLNNELVKERVYSFVGFNEDKECKSFSKVKYKGCQIFEVGYSLRHDEFEIVLALEMSKNEYDKIQVLDVECIEIQSEKHIISKLEKASEFVELEEKLKETSGLPIKIVDKSGSSFMVKGFKTMMLNFKEVVFEFEKTIFKVKL